MLLIRAAQMDALFEGMLERRIAGHLREFCPDRCADLGEGLDALVREGIVKGRSYGLERADHLCQMAALVLLFGRHFDQDPLLPWAGEILRDPSIEHTSARMILLCRAAERLFPSPGGAP